MLEHMEKKSISFILNILSHENKSFIAGSFPLYFISNSCYRYNDIDIYLQWDNYKTIEINRIFSVINHKYFKNTIFENTASYCYTINDDKPSYDIRIMKYAFIKSIKLILTVYPKDYRGEETSTTLQFIFINDKLNDIETYIYNNFDLSFCKCWFDNKILTCETKNFLNILKKIGIININTIKDRIDDYGLIVKELDIKDKYILNFVIPRIMNYTQRGFNIKNLKEFFNSFNYKKYSGLDLSILGHI